jgi:hypothetical protein
MTEEQSERPFVQSIFSFRYRIERERNKGKKKKISTLKKKKIFNFDQKKKLLILFSRITFFFFGVGVYLRSERKKSPKLTKTFIFSCPSIDNKIFILATVHMATSVVLGNDGEDAMTWNSLALLCMLLMCLYYAECFRRPTKKPAPP